MLVSECPFRIHIVMDFYSVCSVESDFYMHLLWIRGAEGRAYRLVNAVSREDLCKIFKV